MTVNYEYLLKLRCVTFILSYAKFPGEIVKVSHTFNFFTRQSHLLTFLMSGFMSVFVICMYLSTWNTFFILYSCTNLSLSDPWKGESNIWPSSCHWCAWKPPGTHSQILLCCCPIWLNSAADLCMFNEIFFWYCELFLCTKIFLCATWSLHFSNIKTCVNLFFHSKLSVKLLEKLLTLYKFQLSSVVRYNSNKGIFYRKLQ